MSSPIDKCPHCIVEIQRGLNEKGQPTAVGKCVYCEMIVELPEQIRLAH